MLSWCVLCTDMIEFIAKTFYCRAKNAICIQKTSKSGFLLLARTSEILWFCCTYCASILATSAAAMTNSVDAIITQVQKEDIDPNGQYIARGVLEESCNEVMFATPTTDSSSDDDNFTGLYYHSFNISSFI
ncbi:unnamed protein product [Anisakis simplex]|uniref:Secreted protein n=1 Tax=Anisakis simplex TaxID=6269 RepID=A0A0M3JUW5_ANISI|nr:unnamed protein product [Anisakis simplex]